jgi:hypothetical protein
MRKLLIVTIGTVALLFNIDIDAQQSRCGTSVDLEWLKANAPENYQRFISLENHTKNFISNQSQNINRLINGNGLIIIPVVVHVLHYGEAIGTGFNISLARIQSQIDVLNEDYRRLNADAVNTPAAFLPVASDFGIEFRLACIDPDGNPTDGVVRKQTSEPYFIFNRPRRPDGSTNEEAIGIKTSPNGSWRWPTDRYLNIWVCNLNGTPAGYAQFPAWYSAYPDYDGVVIDKQSFGRPSEHSYYNKGRTATHEIGHWLNLIHLWGSETENLSCIYDDEVGDTPKQDYMTFGESNNGCPSYPYLQRRCDPSDPSVMFMNYMDNVTDACYNMFSNGQKLRVRALFAAGGPREQQLNNWFKVRQSKTPIRCSGVVYSSPACLSTTWSVLSGPATLTPGPGVNQATLTATGIGTVVIRATSGNYTTDDNIEVTTEPPPFTGTYSIISNYHSVGTQYPLGTNNGPIWLGANQAFEVSVHVTSPEHISPPTTWSRATSSYPFSFVPNGTSLNFYGTSGTSAYQTRNGIFNYTTQTSCGTFNGTYTWPVIVAGWLRLMVSPNPATDNITVSIDEKVSKVKSLKPLEDVTVTLHDFYTNMTVKKWEFRNSQNKFYLNVSELKKGHYILILRRGKDQGVKQILIE